MKKKLYIVDHIGVHSGMHYYNSAFKNHLDKINDFNIKVLSNYDKDKKPFFYNFYVGNNILRAFLLLINYFRLLFKLIVSKNSYFILLSYGSGIDAIFMTMSVFSKKIIIDIHEVNALQLHNRIIAKFISLLYKHYVKTVICHSDRSEKLLDKIGYTKKRIYVPHFKYQFPKTYKTEKIKEDIIQNISNEKINVLFFGYVNFEKGIDILLKATNLLTNNIANKLNVIIAGKDKDGTINTVDIKNNFTVRRILRRIDDDELVYLFTHIDYVILPYRETSQSGILEMAIYFKKPILASKVKYFEQYLLQYPTFGMLMNGNEQSIANKLTEVVDTHSEYYDNYFSDEDFTNYEKEDEFYNFIDEMRELLNETKTKSYLESK